MTPKDILKKAKELKDHLKFINDNKNMYSYKPAIDPSICFYSSQISRKPN